MPHIPMEYTVDLGKTINVTPLHTLFAMGDDNAHRFAFSVVQDGKPVDLSGCTVLAAYTNFSPHGVTVNLDGKIEDGKAVALLSKACYTMEGRFVIVVRLKNSIGTSAIFYGDGYMSRTTADTVIDGDYIIYDVNTLLAKIAEINEATSSANAAAQSANTAAETANAAASNAQEKADMADTAAQGASGWSNATMTATGLPAGSTPTATVTTASDGHKVITLGIPKGDTGATPQISVQVATGAAGSEAQVSVSGTAEEPVIHLTIPRGDTGAIENMTINGKPVESGTITLTAADLGAASAQEVSQLKADKLDKTATAADSSKLGGKTLAEIMLTLYPVGAVYISANSTSPASLFGGTWESIGGRFLLGADETYDAGSMGGNNTIQINKENMPYWSLFANAVNQDGMWSYGKWADHSAKSGDILARHNADLGDTGQPIDNMPPYLAVYMWKRVS